jgi:putative lipoic acid-binding regulatory protein
LGIKTISPANNPPPGMRRIGSSTRRSHEKQGNFAEVEIIRFSDKKAQNEKIYQEMENIRQGKMQNQEDVRK